MAMKGLSPLQGNGVFNSYMGGQNFFNNPISKISGITSGLDSHGVADDDISSSIRNISHARNESSSRTSKQVISDMINSSNSMYASCISSRNNALSKEELKASQLCALAAMIKGRGTEENEWDKKMGRKSEVDWSQYNSIPDIMEKFYEMNPSDDVFNEVMSYVDSDEDPYDFGIRIGLLATPEEQSLQKIGREFEMAFGVEEPNWLKHFTKWGMDTWASLGADNVDLTGQGMDNYEYSSDFYKGNDEAPVIGALSNYVFKNFGKRLGIDTVEEPELMKALTDLQNDEIMEEYLPNDSKGFTRTAEGIGGEIMNIVFPKISGVLGGIGATDAGASWLNLVSKGMASIGQAITYTNPELGYIAYNLPTDERVEWYSFLGTVFFARKGSKKLKNISRDDIIRISKSMNPGKLVKSFNEWNFTKNATEGIKNEGRRILKGAKEKYGLDPIEGKSLEELKEMRNQKAQEIGQGKKLRSQENINAALMDENLDKSKLTDFKSSTDELKRLKNAIWEGKKNVLDLDKNMYYDADLKWEGESKLGEPVSEYPFQKVLEKMLDRASSLQDNTKIKDLKKYKEKMANGEMTERDIDNFIDMFSNEYNAKAYTNSEASTVKPNMPAQDVQRYKTQMREVQNKLADGAGVEGLSSDILKNYNKRYGAADEAYKLFNTSAEKTAKFLGQLKDPRNKTTLQKMTTPIGDLIQYIGLDRLIKKIFQPGKETDVLNWKDLQKDLPKNIELLDEINEAIKNKDPKAIDEAVQKAREITLEEEISEMLGEE